MKLTKEQIYDEQIAPLMAQIIAICKQNKIAHVASFSIPTDADPTLACTTALIAPEYAPPGEFSIALRALRPDAFSEPVFAITSGDQRAYVATLR